jgi:hypothetical protein
MKHHFDSIFECGRTADQPDLDDSGRAFERAFIDTDLNKSAHRLFAYIDRVLATVTDPRYVLLTTVELDMEKTRFPDLLASFFSDPDWDYSRRYFLGSVCKADAEDSYRHGHLTIESVIGQAARLLAFNGGIRWGASLKIGGVQVPVNEVDVAIQLSPFTSQGAETLKGLSRTAWAAWHDLDGVSVWGCFSDEALWQTLSQAGD